jgi:hypothetical protein
MAKDLTESSIARQNILNNNYALQEIQAAVGLRGVLFQGEYKFIKKQIAAFFEVDERTINNCLQKNGDELSNNGYASIGGNVLNDFKLAVLSQDVQEMNFPNKTPRLGIFNFRAFLNIAMLLSKSDKARQMRSIMLDITLDTINKKTGGGTKYINQRDEDFVINLLKGEFYRHEFIDSLTKYVDMGKAKYPIYTDKVYKAIFKEDATEYRKILKLEEDENVRHTMYSEVLDLISSFETGFADELKLKSEELGRILSGEETDALFKRFEQQRLWEPLREKARQKMASRDLCFRDALHHNLKEYVESVPLEDFDRFIGDRSMDLSVRLDNYIAALKRLKERE